tara:strand:- start:123 stop:656 length:534 start_codon:yes stop_codon:yes gene_type:complete
MPDTGLMSPDNVAAGANVAFSGLWITEGGGIIVFFASSGTQTVDGFENDGTLPAGATVVGAEVLLLNTYISSGTGTFDIQLSIDGGSNFSSSITSGTINTTQTNDFTLGGSSNLWGLDWSSFSDLSNLQVKGLNGSTNIFSDHVQIKLHYTAAAQSPSGIKLKGGTFTLKGGTLTIK